MDEIKIESYWENAEGVRGPELAATWASLQILVGGNAVTRIEDLEGHSVRNVVYGPLYPIAEWIVSNWWSLLYEVGSPRRMAFPGFYKRHKLSSAAEGYSLPDLLIKPEGNHVAVEWTPTHRPLHKVQFLSAGRGRLDKKQIELELARFIDIVIKRLEDRNIKESHLSKLWKEIVEADVEEIDFCVAAGRLGFYPYSMTDEESYSLITISEILPPGVVEEFLAAAEYQFMEEESLLLNEFFTEEAQTEIKLDNIIKAKLDIEKHLANIDNNPLPWEQGYATAKLVRSILGMEKNSRVPSVAKIGDLFGIDNDLWEKSIYNKGESWRFSNAAVAANKTNSPCFGIVAKHKNSQVFNVCRALFEYLISPMPLQAIITNANTDRQKRNRAFAAEFIAPSEQLRKEIDGKSLTEEDIQDLAELFETSEMTVCHQIQNHQIAALPEWRIDR